jgi:hypothetical protein
MALGGVIQQHPPPKAGPNVNQPVMSALAVIRSELEMVLKPVRECIGDNA